MAEKRAHVIISGRVQGVNYRSHTRQQAQMQGIRGWVRNRADGRVEAVFEGGEDALQRMIAWCHKGPPAARVESVDVHWEDFEGTFTGFHTRW